MDRDTTLTGLIRQHLQELAASDASSATKRREIEALKESFRKYKFSSGGRKWTRAELYER